MLTSRFQMHFTATTCFKNVITFIPEHSHCCHVWHTRRKSASYATSALTLVSVSAKPLPRSLLYYSIILVSRYVMLRSRKHFMLLAASPAGMAPRNVCALCVNCLLINVNGLVNELDCIFLQVMPADVSEVAQMAMHNGPSIRGHRNMWHCTADWERRRQWCYKRWAAPAQSHSS